PDHSTPDDNGSISQFDGSTIGSMHGDGNRFNHSGMFEGEVLRNFVEDVLWDRNELCESSMLSVFTARNTEHFAIVAQVDIPGTAKFAIATGDGGIERHP